MGFVVTSAVPLLILILASLRIIQKISTKIEDTNDDDQEGAEPTISETRIERRSSKKCLLLSLIFLLSNLPNFVMDILDLADADFQVRFKRTFLKTYYTNSNGSQ